MRVLLLNQFYKPDVAATGQLLADLAEGLARKGHHVHVLCSRRAYGGGDTMFPAKEIIKGVYIRRVKTAGFGRHKTLGRIIDYFSFYFFAFWRALLLPKMDVCVSLTTPPFIALVALILHRFKGTRLVLWTMDLYPEVAVAFGVLKKKSLLYRLLAWFSKYLYKSSSRIVSLGEVMTNRLVEAGAPRSKVVIVHNWVPGEMVHPTPIA